MKKKILIIEDEIDLAELYQHKLKSEGFDVSVARDGEAGLKMAKKLKPDFILLDIVMPKMDGYEVLEAIRKDKDEEVKNLKVYAWTNLGQNAEIKKGLDNGADGYWVKANHTPGQLVSKIKEILGMEESRKSED